MAHCRCFQHADTSKAPPKKLLHESLRPEQNSLLCVHLFRPRSEQQVEGRTDEGDKPQEGSRVPARRTRSVRYASSQPGSSDLQQRNASHAARNSGHTAVPARTFCQSANCIVVCCISPEAQHSMAVRWPLSRPSRAVKSLRSGN